MKQGSPATLKLAPVLDITAAAPLAADLLRSRGRDISIDASGVEKVGAQCIQVLLSAVATWNHDAMEFELAAPSPALVEGLAGAGLEAADFSARNA